MFKDFEKHIKESNERWKKIDEYLLSLGAMTTGDTKTEQLEKIVLLLVEQLRPAGIMDSEKIGEDLKKLLSSISGAVKI